MQYRKLGNTELNVSLIGLGTMTWGEQNTQAEAFEQMDYALERGVNLFDTAEMYAIPPRPETQGSTERIIGQWFKARGTRDRVILATKITGPGMAHIRDGRSCPTAENLRDAISGSLRRLQTDYIDLYQIHWPDRKTNFFGRLGFEYDPDDTFTPFETVLEALQKEVEAGRIRHVGVSNETPWGLMQYLCLAEKHGWPRMVSIQNPYNLLNRSFEIGLAEMAIREHCGLLAYSPLGFGVLSGKYLHGQRPPQARLSRFPDYYRYLNPIAQQATEAYVQLAREHQLDPARMALAFVNQQPFVTSNLIGATTMEQLAANIDSVALQLDDAVLSGIEAIHQQHPNPAP